MTSNEIQLAIVAQVMSGTPLDIKDDALLYAGSAVWNDWKNHVPAILVQLWPNLSAEARLAIYITAKQFTNYQGGNA